MPEKKQMETIDLLTLIVAYLTIRPCLAKIYEDSDVEQELIANITVAKIVEALEETDHA